MTLDIDERSEEQFLETGKLEKVMLDDIDRRILRHFQADPSLSTAELAERCRISNGVCWRRIEKMQAAGIIQGQEAVIDWSAMGYAVEVSLRVTLDKTQPRAFDEFTEAARNVPEVIEIQTFLGRVDVRLSVIARDMAHYQQVYRDRILTLPHIADIEALMHIARVKRDEVLPV
ncbi:Leucine-responsive regulatory protein [Ruegeria arenilitoris]|uniref:Leucine-responsive regulatory protein n=2 Tax=Ruegeria arenilitoris TaxID=1173585 RepID=A0A238K0B8_9RHOB|nr:Leucine-responsive regulatory protein [Ruegeria arenilitoris]